MSLLNFPELEVEKYKILVDKGYWYFKTYRLPVGVHYKPLHRKALLLNLFFYVYIALIMSMFFFPNIIDRFSNNKFVAVILFLSPFLIARLLLINKVYDAARKDYLAINKGERDNLYTSDESLYSTNLEGVYICQTCSMPIASTDSKQSANKPILVVKELLSKELLDIVDSRLLCSSCQSDLGEFRDGSYHLDGEKLALNADELHLIYP